MTSDKQMEDFRLGQSGVRTGSVYNEMGLWTRYTPSAPGPIREPARSDPFAQLSLKPPQRTPEQEEDWRRFRNQSAVYRKPGFFDRLRGRVCSFLRRDGRLCTDKSGNLQAFPVVPRAEHLRRLSIAYRRFFESTYRVWHENHATNEEHWLAHQDAGERLHLLNQGLYLSPLRSAEQPLIFFGRLPANEPAPRDRAIGLEEYDRHCRAFIAAIYGNKPIYRQTGKPPVKFWWEETLLIDMPGRYTFAFFLQCPSSTTKIFAPLDDL